MSILINYQIFKVTDNKPPYNPNTQRLIKGTFHQDTVVQDWIVENIDLEIQKSEKIVQLQNDYNMYYLTNTDIKIDDILNNADNIGDISTMKSQRNIWKKTILLYYSQKATEIESAMNGNELAAITWNFKIFPPPEIKFTDVQKHIGR